MEGDELITLMEPQDLTSDDLGQVTPSSYQDHPIWAKRSDRAGKETESGATEYGNWDTRFQVRRDGLNDMDETWLLVDERGRNYDIQAVIEAPFGKRRWWFILATRRESIPPSVQ